MAIGTLAQSETSPAMTNGSVMATVVQNYFIKAAETAQAAVITTRGIYGRVESHGCALIAGDSSLICNKFFSACGALAHSALRR